MSNIEIFKGLSEEAQQIYQAWLVNRDFGFRNGQAAMIDFLAHSLNAENGKRISVVEAGTGTGKTVAYCIPHILAAKRRGMTLVIATSTVLLQEQLMNSELKDLAQLIPGGFSFGLLKGRRRYACIERIDEHANPQSQSEPSVFGDYEPKGADQVTAKRLLDAFESRRWDGNMDFLPVPIENHQHSMFTTDARSCLGSRCRYWKDCPYFAARNKTASLDVIVVNYSLLLTLLRSGVDALPSTERCIFVFDEAHKLEEIVTNTGTLSCNESGASDHARESLDFVNKLFKHILGDNPIDGPRARIQEIAPRIDECEQRFNRRISDLEQNPTSNIEIAKGREENLRFKGGLVDNETGGLAAQMDALLGSLAFELNEIGNKLNPNSDAPDVNWIAKNIQREALLKISNILQGLEPVRSLYEDWGRSNTVDAARWFDVSRPKVPYFSAPIDISRFLEEEIWSKAFSVTCTSATLVSTNGFNHFKTIVGLADLEHSQFKRIPSPFNYAEQVRFVVPKISFHQPGGTSFNRFVASELPKLLAGDKSALVLFTSRADMYAVHDYMPKEFKARCLVQSRHGSVGSILEAHRSKIDEGDQSFILGLVSFREGVDLPGAYCEHVVIMRLPFNPPGDPVLDAKKENLGFTNETSFFGFDLPEASMKLAQACGRLIRNENDRGTITVFDRRLVEKKYGSQMLKALPDFQVHDLGAGPY